MRADDHLGTSSGGSDLIDVETRSVRGKYAAWLGDFADFGKHLFFDRGIFEDCLDEDV